MDIKCNTANHGSVLNHIDDSAASFLLLRAGRHSTNNDISYERRRSDDGAKHARRYNAQRRNGDWRQNDTTGGTTHDGDTKTPQKCTAARVRHARDKAHNDTAKSRGR
jgi:hypothetical protein